MRALAVLACITLLVAAVAAAVDVPPAKSRRAVASHAASKGEIVQLWYTDPNCTQGLNVVRVVPGTCYFDAYDYSGMEWKCSGGSVVGVSYMPGDINCTQAPAGDRKFPPHECIGPVFNDLYLVASGC